MVHFKYNQLKGLTLPVGKKICFKKHPRPPLSVQKKIQPNRSSRLAVYRQYTYTNVLFYYIDFWIKFLIINWLIEIYFFLLTILQQKKILDVVKLNPTMYLLNRCNFPNFQKRIICIVSRFTLLSHLFSSSSLFYSQTFCSSFY